MADHHDVIVDCVVSEDVEPVVELIELCLLGLDLSFRHRHPVDAEHVNLARACDH